MSNSAARLDIVIFGLAITSAWGNGHATTYRALVRALRDRGHRVRFFERNVPWYAEHRDLPQSTWGEVTLYEDLAVLGDHFGSGIDADLVIVGSYVPEGARLAEWVLERARGTTAFYDIDTPVTLARLDRADCDYLTRALVHAFDLYLSFAGGPILERLRTVYRARRVHPLFCSVDPTHYFPGDVPRRWDLGYLGTFSADRQPALERLLLEPAQRWPEGRFCVAGPQYPDSIRWPLNVQRIQHLAPERHRNFYNSQRFTLNVTRADMRASGYSPSVRLFEAAACGVPIISDDWAGLSDFFVPGREILIAHTAAEVLRCLRELSDSDRCGIAQRARTRVLAEHTAAHRALQLEGYVGEARSTPEQRAHAT